MFQPSPYRDMGRLLLVCANNRAGTVIHVCDLAGLTHDQVVAFPDYAGTVIVRIDHFSSGTVVPA